MTAAINDLTEMDALGLYMEFETVEVQVEAAIAHLLKAQERLSAVVLQEMELATAGKEFRKRPITDHTTRSFVSGMLTALAVQANMVAQVVSEVREACAAISPNCSIPTTVN